MTTPTNKFWLSWYHTGDMGPFELHSPWWITGHRSDDTVMICSAIIAENDNEAEKLIKASYDTPPDEIEWRFIAERGDKWSPFCDRFPRGDWMQWPENEEG